MEGFGIEKLLLLFFIILLLFGSKRIPELASGMGRGIRDFKKALNEPDEEQAAAALPPAEPKRLS
jgi:TatA/E family protein of Tat protein translocase